MDSELKRISCILPASDDYGKTARAILCFENQTWENKELVIIQSGSEDMTPLLEDLNKDTVQYHKAAGLPSSDVVSRLNMGLKKATGQYIVLLSEEEWFHPHRLEVQAALLQQDNDICWPSSIIHHLDTPELIHHPYTHSPIGGYAPGMMFNKNPAIVFSHNRKNPYRHFLSQWKDYRLKKLDSDYSYLFIRHLTGVSGSKAYLSGLRNSPGRFLVYNWLRATGRNLASHPGIRLSEKEKESFYMYLWESQKLNIIASIS